MSDYNGSAYTDKDPGGRVLQWEIMPSNLAALQLSSTMFPVPPGFTVYGAGSASAIPGALGDDLIYNGPGWALGTGGIVAGAYTSADGFFILCDLAQAESASGGSGSPVAFYELNTCEGGDNTYYRTFFCTDKYHH